MRTIKKLLVGTGILIGLVILLKFFFINKSYIPEQSSYFASIDDIRELANDTADYPLHINSLITADGEFLKMTIVAGDNSVNNKYIQTSFQIVYDKKEVLIDIPMNQKQFDNFKYGKNFYIEKYEILINEMGNADMFIFTHEHGDHMGGLDISSHIDNFHKKIIITQDQIDSPFIEESGFDTKILDNVKVLSYKKYHKLAPGVVLIKSPGHTPGHQMIYVKLQNGEEFLFTGDIAWNMANIEQCRNRPLLAILIGGENSNQLGHLIKWLHNEIYLKEDIHIVPSHDSDQLKKLYDLKLIGTTFSSMQTDLH